MKNLAVFAFGVSLLVPSISSAAALTSDQATSLISVVQSSPGTNPSAFVPLITAFSKITTAQAVSLINVVQQSLSTPASAFISLLVSFTVDPVVVQQPVIVPPVTPAPVLGTVTPAPQPTPIPTPVPNWTINLSFEDNFRLSTTTVKANTGRLKIVASVNDKNGAYTKVPIHVTTNDPDLPVSFDINVPITDDYSVNSANFFCVAPNPTGGNGCPTDNPVSVGTFDFTFNVEDVSKTVQVLVIP